MRLLLCAMRDNAVEAFHPPLTFRAEAEAVRAFAQACMDNPQIKQFKEHYSFFLLGTFDDSSGVVENLTAPKLLMHGVEAARDAQPGPGHLD